MSVADIVLRVSLGQFIYDIYDICYTKQCTWAALIFQYHIDSFLYGPNERPVNSVHYVPIYLLAVTEAIISILNL